MIIFNLGFILYLPTMYLLIEVFLLQLGHLNPATECDWKNYMKAFGNQLLLPILGCKTVWDPENKELWNKYLDLKVKKYVFIII